MIKYWTQDEAINLCQKVEAVCPKFGCHVALTGGTLYKQGHRKDCDILFYRIRQVEKIDLPGLLIALEGIGISHERDCGWVHKAKFDGKTVDIFFPEFVGEEYNESEVVEIAEAAA